MNLKEKILEGFKNATAHNSSVMVAPEVILWTDPEKQWETVIVDLQKSYDALFVWGDFSPEKLTGPAIWLKTIISGKLETPDKDKTLTPVIYLPGISKSQIKDTSTVDFLLQPLVEYQYTGTYFNQYNGKDWTVMAMLMNYNDGLGLNVKQDTATKEALIKSLPVFFERDKASFTASLIDADFINNLVFPDTISYILQWMCKGDSFLSTLDPHLKEAFSDICLSRYRFGLDYKNILEITLNLGKQENAWKQVWNYYANSPSKFPEIESLLRKAKPDDLGTGMFKFPDSSWPQVNEALEEGLRIDLQKLAKKDLIQINSGLKELQKKHRQRKKWVWTELGYSPLVNSLDYLFELSNETSKPYPSASLDEIIQFYTDSGFYTDTCMRKAYSSVKIEKDKSVIKDLIQLMYKPWLEKITEKFQTLVIDNFNDIKKIKATDTKAKFHLFVDAFRFEMAKEYVSMLEQKGVEAELKHRITAFPTLTSTAKVKSSPVANEVDTASEIKEFTPQFKSGKTALIANFRAELESKGYQWDIKRGFEPDKSYWVEIGKIDTYGHQEQADMLKRMDDLFDEITEVIDIATEDGIIDITIVTDHGWLMLPGGLPSDRIIKDLTVARCGRCALIKEGVKTDLMQLPWEWNPAVHITYAPGISFFRKNEEFAHGGISLQESIVPEIKIKIKQENAVKSKIENHRWINLRCNIETENAPDGFLIDIRTKFNDEGTSVVLSRSKSITDNKCSLIVDDSVIDSAAFIVLTDDKGVIIDKENTSIGN